MKSQIAISLARGGKYGISARRLLLLALAGLSIFMVPKATSQYSTVELTNNTEFPKSAQGGFSYGVPISTDGAYVAYSTGNAVWSQPIAGGKLKKLFAVGDRLPESSEKASQIYPQTAVSEGIIVFLATNGGGGISGLFGLYSIKADGSEPARRVADSTQAGASANWYDFMNPEGVYGLFQVSKGVVVFGLEGGTLYAANVNGTDLRAIWQVEPSPGFRGCSSGGEYHDIFLANSAYQPATDGANYAFGAGSTLDFEGLYHGPLKTENACNDLIDTGDTINDPDLKKLPGQPEPGAAFAFPQGMDIQIDGGYVYFGAFSDNGVKSGEDYYGYFKIPLKGGKPTAVVTNISHVPGLKTPAGGFAQVALLGFAVNNGKFIFAAQDTAQNDPESFYMVDGTEYVKIFESGTSVNNQCVGGLESGFANEADINQTSLTADGKLVFYAFDLLTTPPDLNGSCNGPSDYYRFQPIGFFVLDTKHPMIPTETEISLSQPTPIVWGQAPSLKIKVLAAEGSKNPKDLVPTGYVTAYFTNPEYFGVQQPHVHSAKLNADGEATIPLGPLQQGTYTYTVAYGGDTDFSANGSSKLTFPLHVTTPTFSVKPGTYKSAQTVNIGDTTPGSTIYYTLNGDTPTIKSKVFSTSIVVTGDETIKAMAVASGDEPSAVAAATYKIQ
jgi:hypothetical protein